MQDEYADIFVIMGVCGEVLITEILCECTWVTTFLFPKGLYQSMLICGVTGNGFCLYSPIKGFLCSLTLKLVSMGYY